MKIPTHIIGFNDPDLNKAKSSFLEKTNGSTFGCKFLTLKEAREQGVKMPLENYPHYDVQLTELAEKQNQREFASVSRVFYKIVRNQFEYGLDFQDILIWWDDFHDRHKAELK